jgi:putative oxidoreductase
MIGLTIHFDKEFTLLNLKKTFRMRKLISTSYSSSAFNLALLVLRVGSGILMLNHGYDKLLKFKEYAPNFMHFLGMNGHISLSFVIFAEFFCSIFIILGLFTRFACIPLLISTSIAVGKAHNFDLFGEGEHAALFFLVFLTILFVGSGKISVDGMINK